MKNLIFLLIVFFTINLQSQNKIEKIEFFTEGYASAPDFDLIIYADRVAIFNARSDNYKENLDGETIAYGVSSKGVDIRKSEVEGIFITRLKKKTFNNILSKIQSLDKEFIKKTYLAGELHNSEGRLKVTYKDGKSLSIYDSGLNGTDNLLKLYNYFKDLRFNQKWK